MYSLIYIYESERERDIHTKLCKKNKILRKGKGKDVVTRDLIKMVSVKKKSKKKNLVSSFLIT